MLKIALLCLSGAALISCATSPAQTMKPSPRHHSGQAMNTGPRALPAGLWMFEPVDATACIDCPTARYVWVLAQGSAAQLRQARAYWTKRPLEPGYPFIATAEELGLAEPSGELVLVGGLYHDQAAAQAAALSGGALFRLPTERPEPMTRALVIVEDKLKAYDPSLRVLLERGLPEQGQAALLAAHEVDCGLAQGALLRVSPAQRIELPDAKPWVELRCPSSARAAIIPLHATTLDLTTQRRADGVVQTLQPSGGVCGVKRFRRVVGGDKEKARELDAAPSCVTQDHGERDPWGICQGDLMACVQRARERAASGDAMHGLRLASYACRFGQLEGCDVSAALAKDPHRALLPRIDACKRGDAAQCSALDLLLTKTSPTPGRDHGMVAVIACQRGHKAWCEALKDSPRCDQDGCG